MQTFSRHSILVTLAPLFVLSLSMGCEDSFQAKASRKAAAKLDQTSIRITATVKKESDLPVCDQASQGLAGYISSADSFVKCSGGRWRSVNPAESTLSYNARSPVRYYEWEDSIEKKRWFIPLEQEVASEEQLSQGCSKGWKLPSKEELMAASSNGLIEGIRSRGGRHFERAWTADFEVVDGVTRRVSIRVSPDVASGSATGAKNTSAGLYCIGLAGN